MSITLVFHGGLFTVLPGSGLARKLDIHMRLPERVKVTDADGNRTPAMEAQWSAATRLDFETAAPLKPEKLLIRPISHLIPIDYQGFHKTIGVTGGTVSGVGKPVPRHVSVRMAAIKKRGNLKEMLREFKSFARITHHNHDIEYLDGMVQEFFNQIGTKELRTWMPEYHIEVKLPVRRTRVVVNGRRASAQQLPDGFRVEFPVDPRSTIPHYPLSNPHILEQPPTI